MPDKLAVIGVTVVDSPENDRASSTLGTLRRLKHQVYDDAHIVVVDNGSTDTTAVDKAIEEGLVHRVLRSDVVKSTSDGVNAAWSLYHEQIEAGSLLAVKYDSDIFLEQDDWLLQMHSVAMSDPELGMVGVRNRGRTDLGDVVWHKDWFEAEFVNGAVTMRTTRGFNAIGYMRQPYGTWGWDDHWDCYRIKHILKLKLGVMKEIYFKQTSHTSAIPEADKHIQIGQNHLLGMMRGAQRGKSVYQPKPDDLPYISLL